MNKVYGFDFIDGFNLPPEEVYKEAGVAIERRQETDIPLEPGYTYNIHFEGIDDTGRNVYRVSVFGEYSKAFIEENEKQEQMHKLKATTCWLLNFPRPVGIEPTIYMSKPALDLSEEYNQQIEVIECRNHADALNRIMHFNIKLALEEFKIKP